MRKRTALILLLGVSLAQPVNGGLGLGNPSTPRPPAKQPAGYRTSEQDAAYQKTIDDNDKVYNKNVSAIEGPEYGNYLSNLDSTYDAMVNDINNGGSGRIAGELPKFVQAKMETVGSASTPTSTATGATGHQNTTTSSGETMQSSTAQTIQEFCPKKCGTIGDAGKQRECMSVCAQGAVATQSTPQTDMSSMLLMSLLLNQE